MLSKDKNSAQKKIGRAIISYIVNDYGNDPLVVKKAKESKKFLEKHGFPKELLEKK